MVSLATIELARPSIKEFRRQKRALKQSMPKVQFWVNPGSPVLGVQSDSPGDGMLYLGRVSLADCDSYEFPFKNNEPSAASLHIRADHYIAKKIVSVPNNPDMCKNIIITVDMYGGLLRWSGLMHHWGVATPDGSDFITVSFNDDLQFLDFMLAPPNPALPIPIFQFPREWPMFGPTRWCVATLILMQLIRIEAHPWTLPDDPFDLDSWFDTIDWADWQIHVKAVSFFLDDSLWTLLASRMNTVSSVIAEALDDAQLSIVYRRIMVHNGERASGLLFNDVKHGALVIEIVDRSGWTLPGGTFFEGTAVAGFFRSVLTWGSGFIEDSIGLFNSTDELYPDEYYQGSWMATLAAAPGIVMRDSRYNDMQGEVTHSVPTACNVIVGGDNPAADAIARLIIEAVGNLLGYFLLAGFDSLGDMAADIIMPFLTGTILAWDEWKNVSRATAMGWIHLQEIFQQGAETNSWSLSALAAMRGGFKATGTQTSHTMVITDSMWVTPGLHFNIGDRVGSTSGALQRLGLDMMFINQIEEMTLRGKGVDKQFLVKAGKNKAQLTMGERTARLLKKVLDTTQAIGVHLIS